MYPATATSPWDNTVLGANTVTLGSALTRDGLRLTNPGGTVTLQGANCLTLDGGAATDLDLSLATQISCSTCR